MQKRVKKSVKLLCGIFGFLIAIGGWECGTANGVSILGVVLLVIGIEGLLYISWLYDKLLHENFCLEVWCNEIQETINDTEVK